MEFSLFPASGRTCSKDRLEDSCSLVPASPPPERAPAQIWPNVPLCHRNLLRADCVPSQTVRHEAPPALPQKTSQSGAVVRPKWSQVTNRKKTTTPLTLKTAPRVRSPDTPNGVGLMPQPGTQPRPAKSANSVKLLAESLSYLTLSVANKRPGRSEPYPVIRISNVSFLCASSTSKYSFLVLI